MKTVNTKKSLKFLLSMSIVGALTVSQASLAQGTTTNTDSGMSANQSAQKGKANTVAGNKKPKDYAMKDKNAAVTGGGWRAETLMGMTVVGKGGEDIGNVENFLLNEQGQIVAVIAEVGGIWDIGDTHVAVPWNMVSIKNSKLHAPITEDNADDYSMFKKEFITKINVGQLNTVEDDVEAGFNLWKATALLNDYVLLSDGDGYGYVSDLTFDKNGKLQSVVVNASNPAYGYGYYAYPWYGYGYDYGWDAGLDYYVLPYGASDFGT